MCSYFIIFFFFKQKTAYEMRISDWSSDVCSSDLIFGGGGGGAGKPARGLPLRGPSAAKPASKAGQGGRKLIKTSRSGCGRWCRTGRDRRDAAPCAAPAAHWRAWRDGGEAGSATCRKRTCPTREESRRTQLGLWRGARGAVRRVQG